MTIPVNQIRDSLAVMGDNSTAFSLPQPHLMRTKLCELKDDDLDPMYVKKRDQLKELVASIIRPKIVQGKHLNGKEFVAFLEQILDALNKGEIPSTGSLVEVFNKGIIERCLKLYNEKIAKLGLPMPEQSLQDAHERSRQEAMNAFDEQHFGHHHAKQSAEQLDEEMKEAYKYARMANEYQSTRLCEELYTRCEDTMDHLQVLRLPSMAKFRAGFQQCFIFSRFPFSNNPTSNSRFPFSNNPTSNSDLLAVQPPNDEPKPPSYSLSIEEQNPSNLSSFTTIGSSVYDTSRTIVFVASFRVCRCHPWSPSTAAREEVKRSKFLIC
ncbi:Guanylate-binding family protein isoform 2 [Hibiscus syriacus]|uniref:Guanylate-binding family protein isoform 2 n=1 Tax=Hibiscus syriacus TaxID=106335 RepID=A0A6A2Z2J3_HIBSY|nr:Guanylate-binding family protein isoform 2 [Hibiscus syriacus]